MKDFPYTTLPQIRQKKVPAPDPGDTYIIIRREDIPYLARYLPDEEDRVLGFADVLRLVPWGRSVLLRMIKLLQIPMIYKSGKRVITRKNFRRAAESDFALPEGRVWVEVEELHRDLKRAVKTYLKNPSKDNRNKLEIQL